ncbi:hypothetical protein V5O48_004443 [Marasmius crinis-equi]|uniref:TOG domain-containing protein n=1 Tax=Marasmius crinis-equi TaxID=585013 RepID=A0ABR3FQ25_9AGAR
MSSPFSQQLTTLRSKITLPETEESWDKISSAIIALTNLIRNGMPDEIIDALREFARNITSALRSERTRLCGPAMELISGVSSELGMSFEPLLPIYFPVLLNLCARSNKVIVNRARACVFSVIENTQLPAVIPYLLQNIKDKSMTLRLVAAESTVTCLTGFDPAELQKEARSQEIEGIIKATSRDANADVRKAGKQAFNAYKNALPNRVERFVTPLTPTIRKYLEIRPKATAAVPTTTSTSTTHSNKKPSNSQLSSSTSATSKDRHTRTNSASSTRSVQPPARPVSVPPTHPAGSTLTASQRDAVRAAMTGAPTRPPQPAKSQTSTSMGPPVMPIRPALHLSRPPSSTSHHAPPQRLAHSRTASASSSNSNTGMAGAPIRMQHAPVRAERAQHEQKPPVTRQPPPQRFPIAPADDSAGTTRKDKKEEIPKPVPQPTNRLRTRAVSMRNLKVGSSSTGASSNEKECSTATTSRSTAAPGSKLDTAPAAKSSQSTSGTSGQAAGNSRVAGKVANIDAFKPVANPTTTRVRPGLTAPTASSQSKAQPRLVQAKKSVAALNIKGKETQASGSGSSSGAAKPGLQSKKSTVDLRRQREEQQTKSRPRSRTVTATSSSRPPSRKGEPVSRPPSRKETPNPSQPDPEQNEELIARHATQKDSTDENEGELAVGTSPSEELHPAESDPVASPSVGVETQVREDSEAVPHSEDIRAREAAANAENQPPQIQVDEVKSQQEPNTPCNDRSRKLGGNGEAKTPISALVLSIEEGFMFSPVRPLSPPEKYLHMDVHADGGFRFGIPPFNKAPTNEERPALSHLEVNQ